MKQKTKILFLTVIFVQETYPKLKEAIRKMNSYFGLQMTLSHILKMDIELGFIFLFKGFHLVNSSLLFLKISAIKVNYIAKDWNRYSKYYPIVRSSGEKYLQNLNTILIKREILCWNFLIFLIHFQEKKHILHFHILGVTKSHRQK